MTNIKSIKELYDKNTLMMQTQELISDALELFESSRTSAIVIVDAQKYPKGILTERDITKYAGHWDEILLQPVTQIMSSPLKTIGKEHEFHDAYMLMSENGFRHLVVVNEDGTLAGVLDEGHFLRHLTPEQLLAVKEVKLVMSKNVTTVETTQSVAETIECMTQSKISSIIIVKEKKPLGILTERDTIHLARHGDSLLKAPISEYMTSPLKTIHEESPVTDAEYILSHEHIRHLIVVNDRGELSGIVSQHDLVKGISGIYVEILRDTIQKQSKLLHKSYNQLEEQSVLTNILDSLPDRLIIACDIHSVIQFTNAHTYQCFSSLPQIGKKLDESVEFYNSSISDSILKGELTSIVKLEPIVYDEKGVKYYFKTSYAPIFSKKKLLQGFLFTAEDITTQKEQNLLLQEKEQQLLQAQTIAKIGNWSLEIASMQAYWSQEVRNMIGVEADISVGPDFLSTIVIPADWPTLEHSLMAALQDGTAHDMEYRIKRPSDHEIRWVNCRAIRILDKNNRPIKLVGTLQDITEKKEEELRAIEREKLFRAIFEQAPVGVAQIDSNTGQFIKVNQTYADILGRSIKELLHIDFTQLTHPDERLEELKNMQALKDGSISHYAMRKRCYRPDGNTAWVNIHVSPLHREHEDLKSHIAIVVDISKQVLSEEQLKRQEELMMVQSRQAAMGEMISMIAHQWRQPLSVVSMIINNLMLDMQIGTLDEATTQKSFEEINDQVQYMSSTIDDFRNFFQHSKKLEEEYAYNILQEILKIIGPALNSNGIEMEIECDRELQLTSYKSELKQVIINILSNAKDALKNIQRDDKIIKISVKPENKYIKFSIFNNGPKIDSKLLKKIFEPYFTTKEILGGTGIGLYMSKSIIEKHMHGYIDVKNTNEGVEFTIRVPKVLELED